MSQKKEVIAKLMRLVDLEKGETERVRRELSNEIVDIRRRIGEVREEKYTTTFVAGERLKPGELLALARGNGRLYRVDSKAKLAADKLWGIPISVDPKLTNVSMGYAIARPALPRKKVRAKARSTKPKPTRRK